NLFLFGQYINKYKTNQIEVKNEISLEENLKNDGIEYDDFPKDVVSDQYMSANTRIFTEKEIADLKNQKAFIDDGTALFSELSEPIKLHDDNNLTELISFVRNYVLHGDQYG